MWVMTEKTLWFVIPVMFSITMSSILCRNHSIIKETSLKQALTLTRDKRQIHPSSVNIDKLTEPGSFTPIVGPTQTFSSRTISNFHHQSSGDLSTISGAPSTLVDYLVPPSPDSSTSSLNFQDPAANLEHAENGFDFISPTISSSNSFQDFQKTFQQLNELYNQNSITNPITPTNPTTQNFQNSIFQAPPLVAPIPTVSLTTSHNPSPSNVGQFLSSKISNNPSSPSREAFSQQFNAASQFTPPTPGSNVITSPVEKPSARVQVQITTPQSQMQSQPILKWDLGFNPNEILTPPKDENTGSFGRSSEYDTLKLPKIQTPSVNLNPPFQSSEHAQVTQSNNNQLQTPIHQSFFSSFPSQQNNQNIQNPSGVNQFPTSNDPFSSVSNHLNQLNTQNSQPNHEINNDQANVIWGSQKQYVDLNNQVQSATTNAPFLPTIPPSTSPQKAPIVQNTQQNLQQNFQSINGFNPMPPPPLPPQYFQFPTTNFNQQIFHQDNIQNSPAADGPQFDSFLPQGTVADHTFQPTNDNFRHFVNKRQTDDGIAEEDPEGEAEAEVEEQQYDEEPPLHHQLSHHEFQPMIDRAVYSYVKTDKDGNFKWSVRHTSRR